MASELPTFRSFVTAFTDFFTVAMHTILYERGIYPQTSFISARKYNFAVRQSRHPKVCEWINDAVNAIETELFKGTVDRIAILIYSKDNKPLERVVFDVSRFPVVPQSDLDVPLERIESDGSKSNILPLVDLEEQLRATMSRLSNCSSSMKSLPAACTFTVAVELKAEGEPPIGHPQPWVPAQKQSKHGREASIDETRTRPIRAVTAGEMIFETWVEELEQKSAVQPSQSFSE